MIDRNTEFFNLYRDLESNIKQQNNISENDKSNFFLKDKRTKKKAITYWDKYRKFRNLYSHKNINMDFEITQSSLESFKKEVKSILKPFTAYDKCIKNIYSTNLTEDLISVVKTMKEKNYTTVPILDERNKLIGVFSSYTLFICLEKNIKEIFAEPVKSKMKAIQEYCKIDYNPDVIYEFISRNMPEYEIKELFEDNIKKKKRLEAIFVTETGKISEKIIGIITPWDIN